MKWLWILLVTQASYGAVGEWVGYEEIEARLRARLFENMPACRAPAEVIAEYQGFAAREVLLNPEQRARFLRLKGELTLKPGFLLSGVLGDFLPKSTGFAMLMGSRFQPSPEAFLMASSHVVNALNTFAWYLTMKTLATKLAGSCDSLSITLTDPSMSIPSCRTRVVPLRKEFQIVMMRLCAGKPATDELIDLLAAPEEREAFTGGTLEDLFASILVNPYFLLEH